MSSRPVRVMGRSYLKKKGRKESLLHPLPSSEPDFTTHFLILHSSSLNTACACVYLVDVYTDKTPLAFPEWKQLYFLCFVELTDKGGASGLHFLGS